MKLLDVKNLNVYLKTDEEVVHAVRNISFEVEKGQTLAIVGESGSGKSVTSMAIMQLLPQKIISYSEDSKILFENKEILSLSEKELRLIRGDRMAMIFQEPMTSLNPYLPIGEQVAEATAIHHPKMSKAEAYKHALDMLKK